MNDIKAWLSKNGKNIFIYSLYIIWIIIIVIRIKYDLPDEVRGILTAISWGFLVLLPVHIDDD